MKTRKLQECVEMVSALALARYRIPLKRADLSVLLEAATHCFMFQPEWAGLEWSCRCISEMYWRFSFRIVGSSEKFVTVYCNWELNGNISIEM